MEDGSFYKITIGGRDLEHPISGEDCKRVEDALKSRLKASTTLEQYPEIGTKIPGLKVLVQRVIESSQSKQSTGQEQKSFFSRFADMARFEEEVAAEVPITTQIDEVLREYVFVDD